MWLDAANARTSAGAVPADGASTVAHWIDSSGRGLSPAQSNSSYYPIYRSSAINGLPAVEFPGSGAIRHLSAPAITTDFASPGAIEMMCAFRRLSAAGSAVLVWALSTPLFVLSPYTDGVAYLDWVNQAAGRLTSTNASLVSSSDWIVLGARRDRDR